MNGTNRQREMGNTDSYEYRVSLIIPIYNMAEWLDTCFQSILNQSIDPQMVEVLMIDDGSEDNSLDIMKRYSEKYSNFKCYTKENGGPAQARNFGIKHATGKYIMYLDPDDYFGRYTIENVCNFFDQHYDEIDVVTYKIIPIKDGEEQKLHFRYEILKSEGVYDLSELRYSFICQTNINICVKNRFERNILFSEEKNFRHEDQKYNIDTLREKQKIGYCENAEYYYVRTSNSITNTLFYAYFIFESTMKFWEETFFKFLEDVPYYIQALYVSDINWKLRSNILLPYHYNERDFNVAWDRISRLLNRCDNKIIIHHPNVEKEHRLYWLRKKSNSFRLHFGAKSIDVFCDENLVLSEKKIHLTLEQCRIEGNEIKLSGVLKPLYSSIMEDVSLEVLCGLGECTIPVALKPSSMSRFHTHEITNKFYDFEVEIDTNAVNKFRFIVMAGGKQYETDTHFGNHVPFRRGRNDSLVRNEIELRYSFRANGFIVRELDSVGVMKKKRYLFPQIAQEGISSAITQYRLDGKKKKSSPIWLYCDCENVTKDNGFYQFEHDVNRNDGVERFYILNVDNFKEEKKKEFPANLQNRIVRFGSRKHRVLFLMADLVIIAFAEHYNYLPMEMRNFKKYSHLLDFPKIVYLQHGVLHAHLPWKYSLDRMKIDKEVISSHYEEENLVNNYGFERENLIEAGMPRYDYIDKSHKPEKKILYAPTWRRYLIDRKENAWVGNEKRFTDSIFYKSIMSFINDDRLDEALSERGYTLDIRLHPIFKGYSNTIHSKSGRVNLITDDINAADYEMFVTDFSSFVFDFVYLHRKILYFVPDYELFKSGMNGYYRLDLPLEDGFGPFVQNEEDAVSQLIEMMDEPIDPRYLKKMQEFFMYKDNHQRERIYEVLKKM